MVLALIVLLGSVPLISPAPVVSANAITLTRVASSDKKAEELAEAAFSSKFARTRYVDKESFLEAFEFFRRHADKEWSFTDCVSTTMKETKTAQAFTFDSHFSQACFESLP